MAVENLQITPIEERDREWVSEITYQRWGAEYVVVHGAVYFPWKLKGFLARNGLDEKLGLITYTLDGSDCEIITLDSFVESQGVGRELLARVIRKAEQVDCSRVYLTTTNDNQRGIAFYRRNGFRLAAVHPGAVERARKLKPSIPMLSPTGIPIRDELEFELLLPGKEKRAQP
jgi:GNAT superfamily N-acetyltransferase